MKKIYFLDFEDSYSYNLIADIHQSTGLKIKVIPLDKQIEFLQKVERNNEKNIIIIVGPGPGSPSDYPLQINGLSILMKKTSIKFLGICLGHQILSQLKGMSIVRSTNPMHGLSIKIKLNNSWKRFFKTNEDLLIVQRYNSLAVLVSSDSKQGMLLLHEEEVMILLNMNIYSMQFHPESIGSIHRKIIFNSINRFFKS